MTRAFVRLGFISVTCILWLVFIVFLLRALGGSQKYAEFRHPLIQSEKPYSFVQLTSKDIVTRPKSIVETLEAIDVLTIPKIDLYPSKSGEWLLLEREQFEQGESILKRIRLLGRKQIQELQKDPENPILSLEEALNTISFSSLAIEVHAQHDSPYQRLLQLINNQSLRNRVVVLSKYEGMIREIRKLEAEWLFSNSEAAFVKVDLMTSLYLETLGSFDFEFLFVTPDKINKMPLRLLKELDKRRKKLILLPQTQAPDESQTKIFKGDGSYQEKLSFLSGTLTETSHRPSL